MKDAAASNYSGVIGADVTAHTAIARSAAAINWRFSNSETNGAVFAWPATSPQMCSNLSRKCWHIGGMVLRSPSWVMAADCSARARVAWDFSPAATTAG